MANINPNNPNHNNPTGQDIPPTGDGTAFNQSDNTSGDNSGNASSSTRRRVLPPRRRVLPPPSDYIPLLHPAPNTASQPVQANNARPAIDDALGLRPSIFNTNPERLLRELRSAAPIRVDNKPQQETDGLQQAGDVIPHQATNRQNPVPQAQTPNLTRFRARQRTLFEQHGQQQRTEPRGTQQQRTAAQGTHLQNYDDALMATRMLGDLVRLVGAAGDNDGRNGGLDDAVNNMYNSTQRLRQREQDLQTSQVESILSAHWGENYNPNLSLRGLRPINRGLQYYAEPAGSPAIPGFNISPFQYIKQSRENFILGLSDDARTIQTNWNVAESVGFPAMHTRPIYESKTIPIKASPRSIAQRISKALIEKSFSFSGGQSKTKPDWRHPELSKNGYAYLGFVTPDLKSGHIVMYRTKESFAEDPKTTLLYIDMRNCRDESHTMTEFIRRVAQGETFSPHITFSQNLNQDQSSLEVYPFHKARFPDIDRELRLNDKQPNRQTVQRGLINLFNPQIAPRVDYLSNILDVVDLRQIFDMSVHVSSEDYIFEALEASKYILENRNSYQGSNSIRDFLMDIIERGPARSTVFDGLGQRLVENDDATYVNSLNIMAHAFANINGSVVDSIAETIDRNLELVRPQFINALVNALKNSQYMPHSATNAAIILNIVLSVKPEIKGMLPQEAIQNAREAGQSHYALSDAAKRLSETLDMVSLSQDFGNLDLKRPAA